MNVQELIDKLMTCENKQAEVTAYNGETEMPLVEVYEDETGVILDTSINMNNL